MGSVHLAMSTKLRDALCERHGEQWRGFSFGGVGEEVCEFERGSMARAHAAFDL